MAGKVRILKEKLFKFKEDDTKLSYVEGACDNDATPPQGNFVTGSAFENVTSGNKYKYSETSGDWVLQPNEGGGGTGGGVLVVHVVESVADKTWQEIKTASASQVILMVNDTYVSYMCEILEPMPPIVEKYQVSFALITDNGDGTGSVSVDTLKCDTANDYPSFL